MPRNSGRSGLFFLIAFVSLVSPGFADDCEGGSDGQDLIPVDSKAVRMASERVDVDVFWEKPYQGHSEMRVKGLFVLVNESDQPQSIRVLFPNAYDVTGFTRTVDGQPVKVEEHHGAPFGNASKIVFAPHQTRHVHVEYSGDTMGIGGSEQQWSYILTTGAHWKGKIDEAIIAIHFPKEMPPGGQGPFRSDAITMTPAGYNADGRTVTWVFDNFKPSTDIALKWTTQEALVASDPFQLASKEEASALLLAQGQYRELRQALASFGTIREFFPDSVEAKTLDFHIATALDRESHYRSLNNLYAKDAIARYEMALTQPIEPEQREQALCEQFVLCCVTAQDRVKARKLLDRIRKEKLESKAADALMEWGRDRIGFQHPQEALLAYDAIRELLPDSVEAKTIDYPIAWVYAHHTALSYRVKELTWDCRVLDAGKGVAHYEAALKQPLSPSARQQVLAELFVLYSAEVPNSAKAQQAYDRLKEEKIDPRDYEIVYKVLALSPSKAMALVDAMSVASERAQEMTNLRYWVKDLLNAFPDGVPIPHPAAKTPSPASQPVAEFSHRP